MEWSVSLLLDVVRVNVMAGHMVSLDTDSVQSAPDLKGLDEGCTDSGRLNFVRWRLKFVGPHYGTCFMLPFWYLEI